MKRFLFLALWTFAVAAGFAQTNLQEMYDFRRGHFATTLEGFYPDRWGSTYFFGDIYHPMGSGDVFPKGYYTEISRSLNFWQQSKVADLSLHVEWNGGDEAANAWLFGLEYCLHSEDYRNVFAFQLLYKRISGQKALRQMPAALRPFERVSDVPMQFTVAWEMKDLFKAKGLTFVGCLDVWGENVEWGLSADGRRVVTRFVVESEPQLWYSVGQWFGCPNLNIGCEVRLGYNFAGGHFTGAEWARNRGFTVAPCLGLKWVF